MAHREDRSYFRYRQRYWRPKHFNKFRIAAWVTIALVALCIAALIVP